MESKQLYGDVEAAMLHGRTIPPALFRRDPRRGSVDLVLDLTVFEGWLPASILAVALHAEDLSVRCAASGRPDKLGLAENGMWVCDEVERRRRRMNCLEQPQRQQQQQRRRFSAM